MCEPASFSAYSFTKDDEKQPAKQAQAPLRFQWKRGLICGNYSEQRRGPIYCTTQQSARTQRSGKKKKKTAGLNF